MNKNDFPSLWFNRREFSTLIGLYAQSVSCNIFKDYSVEYCPTGSWQRFHFKKHKDADSDIYIQIEKQGSKKLYSYYDRLNGMKKRSSNFNSVMLFVKDGLRKRAPAIKKSLFAEESGAVRFSIVDN